ncbi:MAG: hypothetical protein GXY01_01560 [Clostridiales bacterium]|nr:hypothetical protein [Clostridiales bacterium]
MRKFTYSKLLWQRSKQIPSEKFLVSFSFKYAIIKIKRVEKIYRIALAVVFNQAGLE